MQYVRNIESATAMPLPETEKFIAASTKHISYNSLAKDCYSLYVTQLQ